MDNHTRHVSLKSKFNFQIPTTLLQRCGMWVMSRAVSWSLLGKLVKTINLFPTESESAFQQDPQTVLMHFIV